MLALIYKDKMAELLGIESQFVGKVIKDDFEQLEDGNYCVVIDGEELYFDFDEVLVIGILHNPKGIDPLLHQKFLAKNKKGWVNMVAVIVGIFILLVFLASIFAVINHSKNNKELNELLKGSEMFDEETVKYFLEHKN